MLVLLTLAIGTWSCGDTDITGATTNITLNESDTTSVVNNINLDVEFNLGGIYIAGDSLSFNLGGITIGGDSITIINNNFGDTISFVVTVEGDSIPIHINLVNNINIGGDSINIVIINEGDQNILTFTTDVEVNNYIQMGGDTSQTIWGTEEHIGQVGHVHLTAGTEIQANQERTMLEVMQDFNGTVAFGVKIPTVNYMLYFSEAPVLNGDFVETSTFFADGSTLDLSMRDTLWWFQFNLDLTLSGTNLNAYPNSGAGSNRKIPYSIDNVVDHPDGFQLLSALPTNPDANFGLQVSNAHNTVANTTYVVTTVEALQDMPLGCIAGVGFYNNQRLPSNVSMPGQ